MVCYDSIKRIEQDPSKQTWLLQVCSKARYWGQSHGNNTGVQRGRRQTLIWISEPFVCISVLEATHGAVSYSFQSHAFQPEELIPIPDSNRTSTGTDSRSCGVMSQHSWQDHFIVLGRLFHGWPPNKATIKTAHAVVLSRAHSSLVARVCLLSCRHFLYVCGKEKKSDSWSEHHTI